MSSHGDGSRIVRGAVKYVCVAGAADLVTGADTSIDLTLSMPVISVNILN